MYVTEDKQFLGDMGVHSRGEASRVRMLQGVFAQIGWPLFVTPTDFYAVPAGMIEYVAPAPVIEYIAPPPAVTFLRRVKSYLPKPWQPSPLMPALTPPVL